MDEQNGTVGVKLEKEFFDALTVLAGMQHRERTEWLHHKTHQELCCLQDQIDRQDRTVKGVRA